MIPITGICLRIRGHIYFFTLTQLTITCSKLTIETEQGAKYVRS